MKLIGAGLPRTATMAQKVALEMMGVGPCYHMMNVWDDLDRVQHWVEAFDGNADWDQIFDGFMAAVDWPASYYWREMVEAFPDAKVLLSVRNGEAWAESMRTTIWAHLFGDGLMRDLSSARARVEPRWTRYREMITAMWQKSGLLGPFDGHFDAKTVAAAMERHNDEVRQSVAPERLLEWAPSDGLEPLSKFLEVPILKLETPRVNNDSWFVHRTCNVSLEDLNRWQATQQEPSFE